MRCWSLLAALASTAAASALKSRQTTACNNSPDLCSKSYSEITHLGAHNSPFLRDESTSFSISGNQYFSTTLQLGAGVRLLTGQVHRTNGELRMCHSSCDLLDAGRLTEWLAEIGAWMDENPSDVVSIVLVNAAEAKPSELAAEFEDAEIVKHTYTPPSTTSVPETWPTLEELIADDTRLLTFVASLDPSEIDDSSAYLMDEFTFLFETPFENSKASDFSCEPHRPGSVKDNVEQAISSGRLPFLNHFLYESLPFGGDAPAEDQVDKTNAPADEDGNLGDRVDECQTLWQRAPTFVLVDFFDEGPAIAAIDQLNGVTDPVGRVSLPPRDEESSGPEFSSSLPNSLVDLVQQFRNGEDPSLGAWIWGGADFTKTFGGWDVAGKDS